MCILDNDKEQGQRVSVCLCLSLRAGCITSTLLLLRRPYFKQCAVASLRPSVTRRPSSPPLASPVWSSPSQSPWCRQVPSRPPRPAGPVKQLGHRVRGGPPMPRRSAAHLSPPRRSRPAAHLRVRSTGRPSRFSSTSPPAPRGREFLSLQQRSESACSRAISAPLQRRGRPHKVSAPSSSGVARAPRARSKAKGT